MKQKLKVLILEELLSEVRQIERELELSGLHYESFIANNAADLHQGLKNFSPDVIVSAYSLPDAEISEIKRLVNDTLGDVPIIMLSGELSEDMCIEFLKIGIDDYILRPNFKRLAQSIESALKRRQVIAEREKARHELKQSQENFKQMIKGMPFPVAMFDRDMRYVVVSNQWLAGLSLKEEDIIGRSHYEIDTTIPQEWKKIHAKCLKGQSMSREEDTFIRPNGKKSYIRWKVQPWNDSQGQVGGIIIFVESIKEKKKAEEELRKSEETYRQLAENIDEVFWLTDWKSRKLLYISKAYERLYGQTCESLYKNSKTWSDNIHPEDKERVMKQYYENAEKGEYDVEYRVVVNGEEKWVRDKAFPILDENNIIYRMAGLSREIKKV